MFNNHLHVKCYILLAIVIKLTNIKIARPPCCCFTVHNEQS